MRARRWTALALALTFALAGCGGDDDDDDATSTTSDEETTTTTIASLDAEEIDASASPYCAAWAEIRSTVAPSLVGDTEADDEARREYYTDLLPLVEELQAEAPDEIADAVEIALAATKAVGESGDPKIFESADVTEAQQQLAAYAQESCTKETD